jgi:hypothetical protein
MTILFCGGEMDDFAVAGSVTFQTITTSYYRPTYSRGTISVSLNSGANTLTVSYIDAVFAAQTSFSMTGRVYINGNITASSLLLGLLDGANQRLRLKLVGTSPTTIILEKFDGTTATTLGTSTLTVASSGQYKLDLIVNYTGSGRVRLYVDQVLYIDYSGDPRAGGSTSLSGLRLGNQGGGNKAEWSEVIVATQDTRTLSLATLAPNAAGSANAWTGAYTDIDEVTASETDVMTSATANQIANVNTTNMPTGTSGNGVTAVKIAASAARGTTGPTKLALGVRTNSTDSFPTAVTLDTGFATVETYYQQNPVTAATWTTAEIDALQIAFRSEA